MDAEQILTQVDEKISDFGNDMDSKLATLRDEVIKEVKPPEVTPEDKKDEDAKLGQGKAMENVAKMEFWDIPVGQALIGGFSAVFASELVDGFFATQQPMTLGVIKLAGAGILAKWGGRLLGSTGSKAAAIILAYDGVRQIIPLDEWAGRLTGAVTTRTGGGLAGKAGMAKKKVVVPPRSRDYYAGLGGI